MLTLQPEIAQAMVYGDRRPHLVALLVPDPEFIARHGGDQAVLAKALTKAVDRVNDELNVIERIRRFVIADTPFTVENEQLTPSLKIRRHVIAKAYGERLDALFKR
jgi:long-chain acyl-CoA synthetase